MDAQRLRTTLGAPAMARIVARVRQRLERGEGLDGSVTLGDPSSEEREALGAFLGRRPSRGSVLAVRLAEIDARLREWEICAGLAEAIEHLTGPVENLRATRRRVEAEWTTLFANAATGLEGIRCGAQWIDEVRTSGLLRRFARGEVSTARALIQGATAVVRRLPAEGIPIAELAATATGNSHALDPGEPLGTLVVRFAALRGGVEEGDDAERRREAWAAVGVLQDELSAPVLVLNLRPAGGGNTALAMSLHADEGEPYRLSMRQLLRCRLTFTKETTGRVVFVCENPTVVAAAANRLGARCAPIVCVEGNPRVPARLLLARLRDAGIALAYHGDFDWPGIQIGNRIIGRLSARPWRFERKHYLAAGATGARLEGDPVEAVWDRELCATMLAAKTAVHEERELDDLCLDLLEAGLTAAEDVERNFSR